MKLSKPQMGIAEKRPVKFNMIYGLREGGETTAKADCNIKLLFT